MRLTIIGLLLFSLLGTVAWAQTGSPPVGSPTAMTSPGAPQPPGLPMAQPWAGRHPGHPLCYPGPRRSVRIIFLVLRGLLAISAIFALTALGVFLLRRSRPRP